MRLKIDTRFRPIIPNTIEFASAATTQIVKECASVVLIYLDCARVLENVLHKKESGRRPLDSLQLNIWLWSGRY